VRGLLPREPAVVSPSNAIDVLPLAAAPDTASKRAVKTHTRTVFVELWSADHPRFARWSADHPRFARWSADHPRFARWSAAASEEKDLQKLYQTLKE
jgi:hypothetical protein